MHAIEQACDFTRLDIEAWRRGTAQVGYPIVPLVNQLAALAGPLGHSVHLGATTQDIMDTTLVLQTREAARVLICELEKVCTALRELTATHRNTLMAGRSKIQHALPITFGYKTAVWLDMMHRRLLSFKSVFREMHVIQFGGAVGTLAALGDGGYAVREHLANELKLEVPDISWHVSRDRIANLVYSLNLINASLGKIAMDVAHMASTEVAELHEPYCRNRGTSSTMPQKRNPVVSEAILDAASSAAATASLVPTMMLQGHERSLGGSYTERRAVSDGFLYAAAAAELAHGLISGLEVHSERMADNLAQTRGLLMAESVMMALADKVGRHQAHHVLHEACLTVANTGTSLEDALKAHVELEPSELQAALEPRSYLGASDQMIDDVLSATTEYG